jgi:Domain of unknown function (DUF222)
VWQFPRRGSEAGVDEDGAVPAADQEAADRQPGRAVPVEELRVRLGWQVGAEVGRPGHERAVGDRVEVEVAQAHVVIVARPRGRRARDTGSLAPPSDGFRIAVVDSSPLSTDSKIVPRERLGSEKIEPMSASVAERPAGPAVLLRDGHALLDQLQAADWTAGSDEELLDALRRFEALRRRMVAVDHQLILEAEARNLHGTLAYRNVAGLLRSVLRLDPREAAGRVRAAEAAGSRRALTGEALSPAYPLVADAQAAGAISSRHAAIITRTIERLPDDVRQEDGVELEQTLVGYATQFDPDNLATVARRIAFYYDQDGPEPVDRHRARTRDFRLVQRPDGSSHGEFDATAELTELLLTHFDALAGPKPESDGVKDPRTAGQRRHDALLESLKLGLRAERLPTIKGVTATVIVTMTKQQYETGRGLARTSHGALVPAELALRWGGGDQRLLAVVLSRTRAVEAYSSTARLFSENQRLVLNAVDGGCTFPGCSAPPGYCEVHHTIDHAQGGPTDLDHGVLVCGHDHDLRVRQGWTATRIDGRAASIPPPSIDPDRRPRYNELHLAGFTRSGADDAEATE